MKLYYTLIIILTGLPLALQAQSPLEKSIKRGSDLYEDFCVSCHMSYGQGIPNVYPPLAKSDFLMQNRKASIKAIKYGQTGEIVVNNKPYIGYMAPPGLSDDEIADVMNYITNTWGNKNTKMITEEEVSLVEK